MASNTTVLTKVMVNIKVLTTPELRGSTNNIFGTFYAIDEITKSVKNVYFVEKFKDKFEKGQFYIISNVNIGATINIRENSKIMPSAPFHIMDNVEKAFFNPASVSIMEALSSPSKTRVSVKGIVDSISDEIPTSNTKRRLVIIKTEDDIKLVIKLWGNKCQIEIPPKDSVVKVTHLEMTEYLGRKEANSTSLTEIIIEGDEQEITEEIEAACFDSGNMCIILNRHEYTCNESNLTKAFPDMKFVAGVVVKITFKGSRVVSLERIESKAKKSKKE